MSPSSDRKLRDRLLSERGATLKSITFWRGQPQDLTVSDGQGGLYDFEERHLTVVEADLASLEAAIHVLEAAGPDKDAGVRISK